MTQEQMQAQAEKIASYYSDLQQKVFDKITSMFKEYGLDDLSKEEIAEWQVKFLAQTGYLTDYTVNLAAKTANMAVSDIEKLVKNNGLQVAKDVGSQMSSLTGKKQPVSSNINKILESYSNQAIDHLNKNVNNTLLTRNTKNNSAAQAYQSIVNQTALEVQTGLKTPQRALADNVYKWQDNGLKSALVDKNGHNWSLEGYSRMLLNTTANQTYNDINIQTMKDFDSGLAVMSSHAAARVACSYIQGQIVNIVTHDDKRFVRGYRCIYDYDYGKPSGAFGINCAHRLYPYVPGVSHNYQTQYDPEDAQAKMQVQQKQRYYERQIRNLKLKAQDADKLGDFDGKSRFNTQIRGYQGKLRKLIKSNSFLTRQYDREQIFTGKQHTPFKMTETAAKKMSANATSVKEPAVNSKLATAQKLATDISPAELMKDIYLNNPMSVEKADKHNANPKYLGLTKADRQQVLNLKSQAQKLKDTYYAHKDAQKKARQNGDEATYKSEQKAAFDVSDKYNDLQMKIKTLMSKSASYQTNCQRSAPAYELRRRGYDVQALPMPSQDGHSWKEIYGVPSEMWLNKDGTVSEPTMLSARNNSAVTKELMKTMNPGERGTVDWQWVKQSGHIINVERTENGLLFVDAQSGRTASTFEEYMGDYKFKKSIRLLGKSKKIGVNYNRVDNKYIDLKNIGLVVKKADN